MGLREREEIQFLLKQVGEQRRRIKELAAKLDALYRRYGGARQQDNVEPDSRSGRATKASRKK